MKNMKKFLLGLLVVLGIGLGIPAIASSPIFQSSQTGASALGGGRVLSSYGTSKDNSTSTWSTLIQGSNITINTSTPGQVTISGTGGGTPGGSNTQLQFNNSGSFGGIASLLWNGTTLTDSAVTTMATTTVANLTVTQAPTFSSVTGGGTQCLQVNNSGVLAGSGAGCGGGGSISGGTKGYAATWASSTALTIGTLIDNGMVAGANATSSAVNFNVQGTGNNSPFNVASSTGTALLTVGVNGSTTISSLGAGCVNSTSGGALYVAGCATGGGNSAWTIGSGKIYNATSTDLVGIGTITPTTTLFVQGKSGTNPLSVVSSTGSSLFTVDQSGNVTSPATGKFLNGEVGLNGGPSGLARLTIENSTLGAGNNAPLIALYNGAGSANTGGSIDFYTYYFAGDQPESQWKAADDGAFGSNMVFSTKQDGAHGNSLVNRVFIQGSTGNVGINTNNPGSKLEVDGQFAQVSSLPAYFLDNLAGTLPSSGYGSALGWNGHNGGGEGETDIVNFQSSGSAGGFVFYNNTTPLVTMQAGGNVGINTTTPKSTLTVQGIGAVNPFTLASSTGTTLLQVNQLGTISTINGINTAGLGVPAIYGAGRVVATTTAVTGIGSYTVGSTDGSFEISANVLVTTATLHNFTVTCAYTDEGNTARTLTLQFSNLAGTLLTAITNAAGTVPNEGVPLHIRAKAGTSISFATTGTFTTVTYNLDTLIKQTK